MDTGRPARAFPIGPGASLLATLLATTSACVMPGQTPGAGSTGEFLASCGAQALIDDCEDNNNRCKIVEERGGYWYTYADASGGSVEPEAGGTFTMSPGGVNGSKYAARVHGQVGTGQDVYGAMGVNLTEPKSPYDASRYKGIGFWAKKGPEGYGRIRFRVPDVSTDQDAGICTNCSNDFGVDIMLYEVWQHYVLPWRNLKQLPDWGAPRPRGIKPHKLMALQWQANTPGVAFDIWVDDVEFLGCN